MLDAHDEKLVKRYYLLPKAARYSLAALFLTGGLTILLVMIDNIGLGSKGFGGLQLAAMIVLMIAEGAACIACGIAARRGLGSAHWQELEREALGANADIEISPAVLGGIGVGAAGRVVDALDNDELDAGLVNAPELPEEFRQAFLAGDYYTVIDTDLDNTGTLRAWALFDTEPRDEFDEYTSPSISIYLLART